MWSFRRPRQLCWRWGAECPQCRRGTSTALTETHNGQLPALLSGTSAGFKELNQSHKSDWKHRKCADISTCMFRLAAQSVSIKILKINLFVSIWAVWGAAMLVHSLPMKGRKGLLVKCLPFLLHILASFVMSLILTAGRKMTALTVLFLQLSNLGF